MFCFNLFQHVSINPALQISPKAHGSEAQQRMAHLEEAHVSGDQAELRPLGPCRRCSGGKMGTSQKSMYRNWSAPQRNMFSDHQQLLFWNEDDHISRVFETKCKPTVSDLWTRDSRDGCWHMPSPAVEQRSNPHQTTLQAMRDAQAGRWAGSLGSAAESPLEEVQILSEARSLVVHDLKRHGYQGVTTRQRRARSSKDVNMSISVFACCPRSIM